MRLTVEIMLRGNNHVFTETIVHPAEPVAWTEDDVAAILKAMLRATARAQAPDAEPPADVALRGMSTYGRTRARSASRVSGIRCSVTSGAAVGPAPARRATTSMSRRVSVATNSTIAVSASGRRRAAASSVNAGVLPAAARSAG